MACDECKRKKSKCDGGKPGCKRCAERGVECIYNTVSNTQRVAVLRERVKELETELKRVKFDKALLSTADCEVEAEARAEQIVRYALTVEIQMDDPVATESLLNLPSIPAPDRKIQLPLGAMSLDVTCSGAGLQVYDEREKDNVTIPVYHLMPNSFFDDESASLGCTQFYRELRQALAQGDLPERVLGGSVLDVSGFVRSEQINVSHPLSRWAVLFTLRMGSSSWEVQLANAYFAFHLMRVSHASAPFLYPPSRLPAAYSSSSGSSFPQKRILHVCLSSLNLLSFSDVSLIRFGRISCLCRSRLARLVAILTDPLSPEYRDAFIRNLGLLNVYDWAEVYMQAHIRWVGDMASAVEVDPVSAFFRLSSAFEDAILDVRNWTFPSPFDIIAMQDPTPSSMDVADGVPSANEPLQ